MEGHLGWRSTMHCIFNHFIELDSDGIHARGELYNVTCLFRADSPILDTWHGRYLDEYEKREDLQQFQSAFAKVMGDYNVDKVAIRGRLPRGKFAGGAISFKLEYAIQLIADVDVAVLSPTQIKSTLSEKPIPVYFADTGLKIFQEAVFTTAYAAHMLE
jgi:Protein of unknown function (DUF3010)